MNGQTPDAEPYNYLQLSNRLKPDMDKYSATWWQTATGYQIYPRSFCDSNGDGIGDIQGIISKLDYLEYLGIEFIWLSPVYDSPMADNGYDIRDYQSIAAEFGSLKDMDELICEAHARGIGIVMDLVINHTSCEHAWFKASKKSEDCQEHDFYIWRDPAPDGGAPDNQQACFGGSAWHFAHEIGKYYFGYFSAAQPDLNWQNPKLREKIYAMMNWWLDRGIAGFRMDVISLIGKDVDRRQYEEGPYLHTFLQEMNRKTLSERNVVTIGESWSVCPQTALLYCGRNRHELDMVFQFNHIMADWEPGLGKFNRKPFNLVTLKHVLNEWQATLADDGWNSLFLSNHDLPRQVSKYGDDGEYRVRSAQMLATIIHLMKGTPFIYQGEEIGMTNVCFERLDQFRDIETLGHYAEQAKLGVSESDFIAGANTNGRDNARTPMQWTAGPNAGFSAGEPWIDVNPNYSEINVEAEQSNGDGILAYYRKLISLRKSLPIITHGRFVPHAEDHPQILAFSRQIDGTRLSVLANFSAKSINFDVPESMAVEGACLIHNMRERSKLEGPLALAPYEAIAVLGDIG
ncbi:alpha-glucosidase [uncultured Cohaesibacter sp.]|uniref:alpha-glucosidase n=1 Tax=uncultured Cohaesibacter sp. TaxID=1002546 RepID=UPI002AA701B2|nr:alpha-glucosidase [uncultured Cohaesibacter sp.]